MSLFSFFFLFSQRLAAGTLQIPDCGTINTFSTLFYSVLRPTGPHGFELWQQPNQSPSEWEPGRRTEAPPIHHLLMRGGVCKAAPPASRARSPQAAGQPTRKPEQETCTWWVSVGTWTSAWSDLVQLVNNDNNNFCSGLAASESSRFNLVPRLGFVSLFSKTCPQERRENSRIKCSD